MPEELESLYQDRMLTRALELHPRNSAKFPAAVDDTVSITVPLWSTTSLENLLLETATVTGTGVFAEVETAECPEGKVWIPIACELSHTDTTGRAMWFSLKWDRAGVTTTVALTKSESYVNLRPIAIPDLSRLYLGPTMRIHGSFAALGNTEVGTLKLAYLERNLGETFPA